LKAELTLDSSDLKKREAKEVEFVIKRFLRLMGVGGFFATL
jgi:hypothetical protein